MGCTETPLPDAPWTTVALTNAAIGICSTEDIEREHKPVSTGTGTKTI
jgi:hypothetical protein